MPTLCFLQVSKNEFGKVNNPLPFVVIPKGYLQSLINDYFSSLYYDENN